MSREDWLPNPVMVEKLKLLFGQGYRSAGGLLSTAAEPHRLVGLTEDGKVIWWPPSSPEGDEMITMIVDWMNLSERSMPGAYLHLGMAVGTIRQLQQEVKNLQAEVAHHKRVAEHLLERDYKGEQEP